MYNIYILYIYIICICYNTQALDMLKAHIFIRCYMLITVVKKKNSDTITVVKFSALRLCCDLMMAQTMGRNM